MTPHKMTDDRVVSTTATNTHTDTTRPRPETWLMGSKAFSQRMPHHDGIKALWETKWKIPCRKGVYPFHDGLYADFEPIFVGLNVRGVDDGYGTAYTQAFFNTAESLEQEGDEAVAAGLQEKANALYLRAACVLRIARFPYIVCNPRPSCAVKCRAWNMQKTVYMKAASQWDEPVLEFAVPHVYGADHDLGDSIPVYARFPAGNRNFPTVVLLTGLDGYRPDNTGRLDEFVRRGWAAVVLEIPGTADCPADPADPTAPERLWDSLLRWMEGNARFDMRRILCWGLSCGGYYAVRAAHTHRHRLLGCVAQGAGTHYFFDREWLLKAENHEYPFSLLPALAMKHGFHDVGQYLSLALKKFSLLETGILDMPSTRLLLVNGTKDGLMPIEDSLLLFEHGSPKEARFFPGALHMGYPLANSAVYPWMEKVLASVPSW